MIAEGGLRGGWDEAPVIDPTARVRARLEAAIEHALEILDSLDADPDLEAACEDEGAQCDDEGYDGWRHSASWLFDGGFGSL